jgi:hypothetical protein
MRGLNDDTVALNSEVSFARVVLRYDVDRITTAESQRRLLGIIYRGYRHTYRANE